MKKKFFKISIIVPTYNRARKIKRCIESVINQGCDNYELLIIDDGSTDKTSEIVNNYTKVNKNIVYNRLDKNYGVNIARNHGIDLASGNFILFLDSDDYLVKNALEIAYEQITTFPNYNHYIFPVSYRKGEMKCKTCIVEYEDWLSEKFGGDFTHVLQTEILRTYKFFHSERGSEGLNWFRIYREYSPVLFVNKVLINVDRTSSDSLSSLKSKTFKEKNSLVFTEYSKLVNIYEKDIRKYNTTYIVNKTIFYGLAVENFRANKNIISKFDFEELLYSLLKFQNKLRISFIAKLILRLNEIKKRIKK